MTAYYNDNDPFVARWLRNLIDAGLIARGDVDESDIRDVKPGELAAYTQCHFFAGIGGWSHALRLAGWPDDRPVWTGSCPCQPFSEAGERAGFADERHLWPAWHYLISQCRPDSVFGEQVASKDGLAWLDLVQADLEGLGYACGAVVTPAAGVGAPHIRSRLWFVADADATRSQGRRVLSERTDQRATGTGGMDGLMADADGGRAGTEGLQRDGQHGLLAQDGSASALEHATREQVGLPGCARQSRETYWTDRDWLLCTDAKARPVEPGAFPLAHGIPGRVGRLRAYGNAIVPQVAQEVIEAYMREAEAELERLTADEISVC